MKGLWVAAAVLGAALPLGVAPLAHADDPLPPQLGAGCAADLVDAMTLLPDEQTYVVCLDGPGGASWAPAPIAFDPHDIWLSYGPVITLHGQGMRNPNVTAGEWTATPRDPQTVCRAAQQTVVQAGVLSDPQVSEADAGAELTVRLLPRLFYLELSGDCLWEKA